MRVGSLFSGIGGLEWERAERAEKALHDLQLQFPSAEQRQAWAAIEAENASLLESLREVRESHAKLWAERTEIIDRYTAAEQRNTELESLARRVLEYCYSYGDDREQPGMCNDCNADRASWDGHRWRCDTHKPGCTVGALEARAALHDEERSTALAFHEAPEFLTHGQQVTIQIPDLAARLAERVRLLEGALGEIERRASVGPPSPPGRKAPRNQWYDLLVWVGLHARAALATHDEERSAPPPEEKTPTCLNCGKEIATGWVLVQLNDGRLGLLCEQCRPDSSRAKPRAAAPEALSLDDAAGITDVIRGTAQGEEK